MPDPVPYKSSKPLPPLVPGPIDPRAAPPGPPPELSLPAGHSSAFQCENYAFHHNVYFHYGAIGLRRSDLGSGPTIVVDTNDLSGLDLINPGNPFQLGVAQTFTQVQPNLEWGYAATVGIIGHSHSLELTGFYLPEQATTTGLTAPGMLNTFFVNPPVGFAGNNGLFTDADIITTSLQTALGSVEMNVRHYKAFKHIEPIYGIRYMDLQERFSMFVDDDGLTFVNNLGQRNATRQATYSVRAVNRIVAPQFGIECQHKIVPGVAVGLYSKAAVGVNFAKTRITLNRGDGLVGLGFSGRHRINISGIGDVGGYLDLYFLERFRARFGYQVLFMVNVLEAVDQIDFNLANPRGRQDNSSDIIYHGPRIEVQLLF